MNDKLMLWTYFESIRYAKIDEGAFPPTRKHLEDAGIDFYALKSVIIAPHQWKVVETGIAIEIPKGYFGLMKPKGRNHHLVGAGVVDAGYQGQILFKIFNVENDSISFLPGQPLGQMVIIPIVTPELRQVSMEEFYSEQTERGESEGIYTDRRE